jgi:alkanesulfonate monooxygenase SsuD/methylene tetrahydromethanopterin reductase-like flavin-dependent oxidoreductase (luciferase family)
VPIELRAWLNPQSYSNSYSTAGIAREAAYFTPVPEPVTADPDYITAEAREYEATGYDSAIWPQSATWSDVTVTAAWALARTQRLRVVLAHRPGTQALTAAARALATLDRVSDGRTGVHLILGSGADLSRDGDQAGREERYRRATEYLEIFRSIREDRFADLGPAEDHWEDGVLYLGLTALSRATPALVGSPSTIADAVLAYRDLGIGAVTLGSHVTASGTRSSAGRPSGLSGRP